MSENPLTIAQILELPVHVVEIGAKYLVQTPKKTFFLNLPHHGKKNIVMIGSSECLACLISTHHTAGKAQNKTNCLIYKIDSNSNENKKLLTSYFGEVYHIPKYFIEHEDTSLTPWDGNNMNANDLVEDLQTE